MIKKHSFITPPPIEFLTPLSPIEVKMTLKELCGSKWDNFPFNGTVDNNAFKLTKNHIPGMRGFPRLILNGDFTAQGNQTKVTVSVDTKAIDIISLLIFALCGIGLAIFGFVSMLNHSLLLAIYTFLLISGFTAGVLFIDYILSKKIFRKRVKELKNALKSAE